MAGKSWSANNCRNISRCLFRHPQCKIRNVPLRRSRIRKTVLVGMGVREGPITKEGHITTKLSPSLAANSNASFSASVFANAYHICKYTGVNQISTYSKRNKHKELQLESVGKWGNCIPRAWIPSHDKLACELKWAFHNSTLWSRQYSGLLHTDSERGGSSGLRLWSYRMAEQELVITTRCMECDLVQARRTFKFPFRAGFSIDTYTVSFVGK